MGVTHRKWKREESAGSTTNVTANCMQIFFISIGCILNVYWCFCLKRLLSTFLLFYLAMVEI